MKNLIISTAMISILAISSASYAESSMFSASSSQNKILVAKKDSKEKTGTNAKKNQKETKGTQEIKIQPQSVEAVDVPRDKR
jgi:hypothetical protein